MGKKRKKQHFERGLHRDDLHQHITSTAFNQPHPELAHNDLIRNALAETIFSKSETSAIKAAIRVAKETTFRSGKEIVTQGSHGDSYYVVEKGTLDVIVDGKVTATYGPGQHFGELALIYNDCAEATVKVSEGSKAKLWVLTRKAFRKIQHQTHGGMLYERAKWMRQVEIFNCLSASQVMRMTSALVSKTYKPDEVVRNQGDSGDTMFLVYSGCIEQFVSGRRHSDVAQENVKEQERISLLEYGETFGEHALINRPHHYNATYKAGKEGAELLLLTTDLMDEVLGPLQQVLEEADILNSLLSSQTGLSKVYSHHVDARHELHPLIAQMQMIEYSQGDVIIPAGAVADGLFVLKTGQVTGYGTCFNDGDTFGEECLLDNTPAAEDVVAGKSQEAKVRIYLLPRDIALAYISRHEKRDEGSASACSARSAIKLADLEDLGLLGEGSFGTVTMVKTTFPSGDVETLALKRMGKAHLVEEDMLESTEQERQILGHLSPHPFVLRLYATYQDRDSVYMLTNLCQGGELYDYLHAGGVAKELALDDARFYTANIFLGLSHLHEHGFVFRDLKPENVLINADGYLCLIDFGFAKACPYALEVDGQAVYHEQCFTACGTPEYMAPEFIFQTGHDKSADYWALGCLVFEMFHGFTPFVDTESPEDMSQIFVNIALYNNGNYELPFRSNFQHREAASAIHNMLREQSVMRLGVVEAGKRTFMKHPYFDGFDWDALLAKKLDPPMKPTVKDRFDKSNFVGKVSELSVQRFDVSRFQNDPFEGW